MSDIQQAIRQEINGLSNRNHVEFLTTASNVTHAHFQIPDSDLHIATISAIKNDYIQNNIIDVQKPHQAEVFRIATALQALHSTAPVRTTQCSMH